jgi:hypothetical protein
MRIISSQSRDRTERRKAPDGDAKKAGCRIRTCALQEEVIIELLIRINRRNHLAKPALLSSTKSFLIS